MFKSTKVNRPSQYIQDGIYVDEQADYLPTTSAKFHGSKTAKRSRGTMLKAPPTRLLLTSGSIGGTRIA